MRIMPRGGDFLRRRKPADEQPTESQLGTGGYSCAEAFESQRQRFQSNARDCMASAAESLRGGAGGECAGNLEISRTAQSWPGRRDGVTLVTFCASPGIRSRFDEMESSERGQAYKYTLRGRDRRDAWFREIGGTLSPCAFFAFDHCSTAKDCGPACGIGWPRRGGRTGWLGWRRGRRWCGRL